MTTQLKISKNVTFELDNLLVIERFMTRTKKNFSQTVNILIRDWITIQKLYKENQEQEQQIKEQHERELREQELKIKQAKPLKEV
jgi:hypothetical protein